MLISFWKVKMLVNYAMLALLLTTVLSKGCMNVQKCLCADGGDSCLSPRVFEDDLIGYFSFDEQIVADESGNLRVKPQVISGPGYGLTSASLYSSASNAYTITGDVLNSMHDMSLSFWIYFIMRGEGWVSIMRKGKDGKSTPSLSVSSLDGTIELVVATTNDPRYSILSNGALQTGRWNHIGVTISRSAVVLYLNGFQDSMRNFDSKFNNDPITIGANEDRFGAEMFIDEFKLFKSFLPTARVKANSAGAIMPFASGHVKLACLDCSMKEAFNSCQEGYHLASIQELIAGGYQLALSQGWNKMNGDFWSLDPQKPNVQEMRLDSSVKKAGICFKDKD